VVVQLQPIVNIIDYITIASLGNAADFGDLQLLLHKVLAKIHSNTRGIFAGAKDPRASYTDAIDYVTISTTGNATDFGNLTGSCK
jgi:hypothetical protein